MRKWKLPMENDWKGISHLSKAGVFCSILCSQQIPHTTGSWHNLSSGVHPRLTSLAQFQFLTEGSWVRTTPAGWIGEVSGCFKRCVHAKSPQLCPTLCDSMDCSPPGSSVHEFSRQEYWSGLPFPSPRDLPDTGTKARSSAQQADSFKLQLASLKQTNEPTNKKMTTNSAF